MAWESNPTMAYAHYPLLHPLASPHPHAHPSLPSQALLHASTLNLLQDLHPHLLLPEALGPPRPWLSSSPLRERLSSPWGHAPRVRKCLTIEPSNLFCLPPRPQLFWDHQSLPLFLVGSLCHPPCHFLCPLIILEQGSLSSTVIVVVI